MILDDEVPSSHRGPPSTETCRCVQHVLQSCGALYVGRRLYLLRVPGASLRCCRRRSSGTSCFFWSTNSAYVWLFLCFGKGLPKNRCSFTQPAGQLGRITRQMLAHLVAGRPARTLEASTSAPSQASCKTAGVQVVCVWQKTPS